MKKAISSLALAILLLSLGTVTWIDPFGWRSGGPPGPRPISSLPEKTTPATRPDPGAESEESLPANDGPDEPTAVAVELDEVDRDLDLTGIVTDGDGQPIAGAEVATSTYPWRRVTVLNTKGYDEERKGPSTRTAQDGSFRLRLARGQSVVLNVSAPEFANTVVPDCLAGAHVEVELAVASRLEVRAIDEDGEPVADVRVRFWRLEGASSGYDGRHQVTGKDGRCVLRNMQPGKGTVDLDHDVLGSPSWQKVDIPEGDVAELEVVLPAGRTIAGRVVDADTGEPIAGARVGANWTLDRAVRTNAEGGYAFVGWTGNGVIDLHVIAEGYGRQRKLVPDEGDVDFEVDRGYGVAGRLVSEDGEGIGEARVTAMASRFIDGSQEIDTRSMISAADGSFELTSLRTDLPHTLVVQAEGFGRYLLDFDADLAGDDGVVALGDLIIPRGRRIEGVVVDSDGQPLARAKIVLSGENDDRDRLRGEPSMGRTDFYGRSETRRTDDLGRFRFIDLSPGTYQLRLAAPGLADRKENVQLPPDRDLVGLEFAFESGEEVVVLVKDATKQPVEGARVDVSWAGHSSGTTTDGDGRALLRGLPDGDIWLRIAPSSEYVRPPGRYVRPRGQEVVFVLREAAWIEGDVVDPRGDPAARVEIRWRLVGVDRHGTIIADRSGHFRVAVERDAAVDLSLTGRRWPQDNAHESEPSPLRGELSGIVAPASGLVLRTTEVGLDRTLTILTLDPDGAPLPAATVWISGPGGLPAGESPRTDETGRLVLENLPPDPLNILVPAAQKPGGDDYLVPGRGEHRDVVPAGQTLRVQLFESWWIRGQVVDARGNAVTRAHITARSLDEEKPGEWKSISGRDGAFRFLAPRDRRYAVEAELPGEAGPSARGKVDGVDEQSGEIVIQLR